MLWKQPYSLRAKPYLPLSFLVSPEFGLLTELYTTCYKKKFAIPRGYDVTGLPHIFVYWVTNISSLWWYLWCQVELRNLTYNYIRKRQIATSLRSSQRRNPVIASSFAPVPAKQSTAICLSFPQRVTMKVQTSHCRGLACQARLPPRNGLRTEEWANLWASLDGLFAYRRLSWIPPCNGWEPEEGLFSRSDSENDFYKQNICAIMPSIASICKSAH